MKSLVALGLIALVAGSAHAAWQPGPKADPQTILNEAQEDAQAGRFEDALAKHVWFYENALTYEPAMYGVRLSFALSYWKQLGEKYPPALEKLRSERDAAGQAVRNAADAPVAGRASGAAGPRRSFNEYQSINDELGEGAKTSDLFLWVDENRPHLAPNLYDIAEPALIAAKEYKTCGKYVDGDKSFEQARHLRDASLEGNARIPAESRGYLEAFEEETFARSCATTVALLVITGHIDDARRIAEKAKEVRNDEQISRLLADALRGKMPVVRE